MFKNTLMVIAGVICLSLQAVMGCFAADKVVVIPLNVNAVRGTQYYTINSAEFVVTTQDSEHIRPAMFTASGYLEILVPNSTAVAPVNLPSGAKITAFTTYIKDVGGRCTMTLTRQSLQDSSSSFYGPGLSAPPTPNTNSFTSVTHQLSAEVIIDYQNYHYFLTWDCDTLSTNAWLYAVRFTYTL